MRIKCVRKCYCCLCEEIIPKKTMIIRLSHKAYNASATFSICPICIRNIGLIITDEEISKLKSFRILEEIEEKEKQK